MGEERGEGNRPYYSSIAITIASPIFLSASRFFSVGGSATLIRRQLRYFPEAENSDPAAAWIFRRHSCLLTHTISSGYSRLNLGVFGVHVKNLVTKEFDGLHNVHPLPHQVGGIHVYPNVLEAADPFLELEELGGGEHGVGGVQFPSQFHACILGA